MKKFFNLRNVAVIVACLAVTSMMFSGCKDKDSDNNGNGNNNGAMKFSPPAWIQGKWGDWQGDGTALFRFTSDDVVYMGKSFAEMYTPSAFSMKETKKTDALYEIVFTVKGAGVSAYYSFKKVDETHIGVANNAEGEPYDYSTLEKMN